MAGARESSAPHLLRFGALVGAELVWRSGLVFVVPKESFLRYSYVHEQPQVRVAGSFGWVADGAAIQ